ncbi:MAG TPA: winged helix-turn-helix domain-containing protein [Terriglobales bacterium]|nr:winged helix-turn-helix domain-containing protein [Terriglobales bacterium]
MSSGVIKFADFELDRGRYELRRGDRVLKLEKIPMELLVLLAESNGRLVTRDEIVGKIWGKDVFLDTEHGINTAIRKIRQALGDDPENPRFVQTVTGKGYRFVAATSFAAAENGNPAPPGAALEDAPQQSQSGTALGRVAAATAEGKAPAWSALQIAIVVFAAMMGIVAAVVGLNVRDVRDRVFSSTAKPRIHSLAVLPLENLSADPAQEYFADGMTDELITMLAKNADLRVVSRTSVMQYKKVHRPLADVARELGVDGILEGSVERSGSRVHINAQLIYAPQDRHVWAESYDRDLSDLASLQTELAQTISRQVGLTAMPVRLSQRSVNAEAYDRYLLGRYYWFGHQYDKSREHFLKAIQLQPDYAAAHAALADSYTAPVVLGAPKTDMEEAMVKAESAARQAIALDDSVAEAHLSMAAVQFFLRWNWEAAERESARAVELNPRYSEAHHLRAYVLLALQRSEEAVQEDRKSMELDPRIRPWALGYMLLRTRQFEAGIAELRARDEVQPGDFITHDILSELYWHNGMRAESIQELARDYVPKSAAELEAAFRRGGVQGATEWRLAHVKKLQARMYVSPWEFAGLSAHAGHREETLHWLEQSYAAHVPWLAFIQNEPDFDFIHSDPRYEAIVKGMKLPPAQETPSN